MKWNELYPGDYLQSISLLGHPVTTMILDVKKEMVENKQNNISEEKVVLYLHNLPKMVCNKTNAKRIAQKAMSNETDDWKGIVITLYSQQGTWFGEEGTAVRVKQGPEKVIPFLTEAQDLKELEIRHKLLGDKSDTPTVNRLIKEFNDKK